MDRSIFDIIRRVGGAIRQQIEMYRKRDVVLVSAAGTATFMAFVFFVIQTISAVAG
jgi:hypothetical protein